MYAKAFMSRRQTADGASLPMNPNEHLVVLAAQLEEQINSGKSLREAVLILASRTPHTFVDLTKVVQMVWNLHSPEAAQIVREAMLTLKSKEKNGDEA